MRLVTAAALLAALASAPSGQTQYADSAGAYVGVHSLAVPYGTGVALGASVGWRLPSGLDYGVQFEVGQTSRTGQFAGTSSAFAVGPTLGYTQRVGAGVLGRVSTAVLYRSGAATFQGLSGPDGAAPFTSYSVQSLEGSVAATVSRPVRLYGSLRVQPTVGVLAEATRLLSFETTLADLDPVRSRVQTGVILQVPVSLRVLGSDVTLAPGVVVPVTGDRGGYSYAGGGLRVNF